VSEAYEANQRYSEAELIEKLNGYLKMSWLKRDTTKFNSASVAITADNAYFSGLMESRTHLLDVTSEQAVLVNAVASKDPHVMQVVTLVDGESALNPIVMKVLADHVRRTGTAMAYKIYSMNGELQYACDNVLSTYYKPAVSVLEKIKDWKPRANKVSLDNDADVKKQLRASAIRGMRTHFSAGTKTCYGAAVVAGGQVYFGGVYSSFDRRMNLHAEMVAALSAFADGKKQITHVGLVSNKFVEDVPHMCGCCRQFFSEVQDKTKKPITFYGFSFNGEKTFKTPLSDYLPNVWDSGEELEKR
jgi:cytidine deaminase